MKKIIGTIADEAIDAVKVIAQKSKAKVMNKATTPDSVMDGYIPKANYNGPLLRLTLDDDAQIAKISDKIGEILVEKEKLLSMSSNPKLTKSQREYYMNLALDKDASIRSLEQEIKDIKMNRISAQRAEMAKETAEDVVVQPKKRGRKKKIQEPKPVVTDPRTANLVPLRTYDGLLLELTEYDKKEISKIREKIALLNIEMAKLDSMSSNTKLHKNRRWACANELERKQSEVNSLLKEIDNIKKERFSIQKAVANGTYLEQLMDTYI